MGSVLFTSFLVHAFTRPPAISKDYYVIYNAWIKKTRTHQKSRVQTAMTEESDEGETCLSSANDKNTNPKSSTINENLNTASVNDFLASESNRVIRKARDRIL